MSNPTPKEIVKALTCEGRVVNCPVDDCRYNNIIALNGNILCALGALERDAADMIERQAARIRELEAGYIELQKGILNELEAVRDAWDASRLNGNGDVAKGIQIAINRITGISAESSSKTICKGNGLLCRRCTEKCGFRVEVKLDA